MFAGWLMWQNNSIRSTACRSVSMACRKIFVELFLYVFINGRKKKCTTETKGAKEHVENYLILQFFGCQTIFDGFFFLLFLTLSRPFLVTLFNRQWCRLLWKFFFALQKVKRCENHHRNTASNQHTYKKSLPKDFSPFFFTIAEDISYIKYPVCSWKLYNAFQWHSTMATVIW